jgi:hypothetical protein
MIKRCKFQPILKESYVAKALLGGTYSNRFSHYRENVFALGAVVWQRAFQLGFSHTSPVSKKSGGLESSASALYRAFVKMPFKSS